MIDRRHFLAVTTAALAAGRSAHAQTDAWPSKPLRFVVGFSAGSTPDLIARTIGDPLAKLTGQPVVVEDKPGASGNIAADIVAKARDDHTVGVMINLNLTTAKLLNPALTFDPHKDLAPVCLVGTGPLVITLAPRWKGKADLNSLTAAGAKLNYGSVGVGSMGHLGMEILSARLGTAPTHVPYPGNPQVLQALANNEVDVGLIPAGLAMPQVRAGKVEALAVAASHRSDLAPGVPSLADLGIKDLDIEVWVGIAVASSMPAAHRKKLEKLVIDILRTPEVRKQLGVQGWDVAALPADAFARRIEAETAVMGRIIEKQNIRLN
ncbi:MAG: tripartite tricarboxylate transporter substrate binding protein [Proteobacteria bacterium]|nr:tripartite tricarboxylate transporter substrate binding protein [Pseudomonadota bacterium]